MAPVHPNYHDDDEDGCGLLAGERKKERKKERKRERERERER